ncbi:MAG: tetratricopeptide repeat protein, partial [Planctomycetota bacterium]
MKIGHRLTIGTAAALILLNSFAEVDPAGEAARLRDLIEQGLYTEAEAGARTLLTEVETGSGPDSVEASIALDALVEALTHGGRAREPQTIELAGRALEIKRRRLGETHEETARSLGMLGHLKVQRGAYEEGRDLIRRAVEASDAAKGAPPHPVLATNLNFLGGVLWWLGDYAGAQEAWERTLAIRERDLGPQHRKVAIMHANLALVLEDQGDYAGARRAYERAVAVEQRVAPDHPGTANTLNNLGHLLWQMGDYAGARVNFLRSLEIREKAFGPGHPRVAENLNNLGMLCRVEKQYDAAREYYERALAIKVKHLGENHPQVANTLNNLGNLLSDTGNYAAAESYHLRALAAREATFGKKHLEVAKTLHNLADLYWKVDRVEESIALEQRAITIRQSILGDGHPSVAESWITLGHAKWRGSRAGAIDAALEAEAVSREHLRLSARALPEGEALDYAAHRRSGFDILLTVATERDDVDVARVWDAVIRSRALVFDEMAARNRVLHGAGDAEAERLIASYRQTIENLAKLIITGPGSDTDTYRERLREARFARERAERALAAKSERFRASVAGSSVSLESVRRALPPNGALIAYVGYEALLRPTDGSGGAELSRSSYAAFVIGPGRDTPEIVALGPARDIEDAVRRWREAVVVGREIPGRTAETSASEYRREGAALRRLVWDPVAPHVDSATSVLIVPDGALPLVRFGALPIGDGEYLIEQPLLLHYLSAERDVVKLSSVTPGRGGRL